jgi:hypothetical protein
MNDRCATRPSRTLRPVLLLVGVLTLMPARSHAVVVGGGDPDSTSYGGASIYLGMWTSHFRHLREGLANNWLVGFGWKGYYAGTFINSYGKRAFTAGVERIVTRGSGGSVIPMLGYRLGLISGYDSRFLAIAGKTPVLPMAQITGALEMGPTGIGLDWSGLVASLVPSFRL